MGDIVILQEDGLVSTRQGRDCASWKGWSGESCDFEDTHKNLQVPYHRSCHIVTPEDLTELVYCFSSSMKVLVKMVEAYSIVI